MNKGLVGIGTALLKKLANLITCASYQMEELCPKHSLDLHRPVVWLRVGFCLSYFIKEIYRIAYSHGRNIVDVFSSKFTSVLRV
jgi:hypothetical protein